jgi:hypothetical protein
MVPFGNAVTSRATLSGGGAVSFHHSRTREQEDSMTCLGWLKSLCIAGAFAALALGTTAARAAEPKISEWFFNAPGTGSSEDDGYFEIGGAGSAYTANFDYYVVCLENESANAGKVDYVVKLNGNYSFNASGFLWLVQDDNSNQYNGVAEDGEWNSIGTGDAGEASGGTMILLKVASGATAPVVGDDWDTDDDGDIEDGGVFATRGWTRANNILDSIGVSGESDDFFGGGGGVDAYHVLYGTVNFGVASFGTGAQQIRTPAGASNFNVNDATIYNGSGSNANAFGEIEYVGRYDSGAANTDWFAANLTTDSASGYDSSDRNYGISGNHSGTNLPECVRSNGSAVAPFAYGTDITITLDANNVP